MTNKYSGSHPIALKRVEDSIAAEKDVASALQSQAADIAPVAPAISGSAAVVTPARTLACPDFDGEPTPNFERWVEFDAKPLADFNSSQTFISQTSGILLFQWWDFFWPTGPLPFFER